MDDIPILGRAEDRQVFQQVLAQHGAPACIRRAQRVQAAFDQLLDRCRCQRLDLLNMVSIRLGMLQGLAGDGAVLRPLLADPEQMTKLSALAAVLQTERRAVVKATSAPRALRQALLSLRESLERFNQRWSAFLAGLDLTPVNDLRDGYNRYYVLEKECAVRSPRVARQGFQPLAPLTVAELTALFPLLPIPELLAK